MQRRILENYLGKVHGRTHAIERSALALLYKLTTIRGTPGIHCNKPPSFVLYTYRDQRGVVVGSLIYYKHAFTSPAHGPRFAGWCEMAVAKLHQRQGIAMQLLARANEELDLKPFEQAYSPEGYLLMCKFLGLPQLPIDELRAKAAKAKFGTLALHCPAEAETVSQAASMGKVSDGAIHPGSPLLG